MEEVELRLVRVEIFFVGDDARHWNQRFGVKRLPPCLHQIKAADNVYAHGFAFEHTRARHWFGQDGGVVVLAQKQPHRFGRRGGVGDADFMRVDFQFFQQGLQHDVGHVVFKRHEDFFANQILRRGNRAAFADQLRDAVGQNIHHADFLPLVAQVHADIARTHHDFKLPTRHARAKLVGRTPNLQRHIRLLRQLALQRRYGDGNAGHRRRAVHGKLLFPRRPQRRRNPCHSQRGGHF